MVSFSQALAHSEQRLVRGCTVTLQVNVGLKCNQACKHCHLDAGPERTELMGLETMREVADYALRGGFQLVDITGGAPELNPNVAELVELTSRAAPRVWFRSNLTVLTNGRHDDLLALLARRRVTVVASFPSLSPGQADAQRGPGVFQRSLEGLARLNRTGYGRPGSGLELHLVSNPAGAFLPPDQAAAERRFRGELARRWDISFNQLFAFANVPLGRFRKWLRDSGNLDQYLDKLAQSFNPCAVEGVMCRSLVSVGFDGILYDCDFNLAADLPMGGRRIHVSQMAGPPEEGSPIAVREHCYTCTAGSGFT